MNKLYYISQPDHLENIENVCKGGVKLVQLRVKNMPEEEIKVLALKAQSICKKHKATFILNDHVAIAKAINADGIHLGKEDTCPLIARQILGPNFIIGGTANTYEDCKTLASKGVDYIGLGPFKFTETKKKLSPVLGMLSYQNILEPLKNEGIQIPIYAIGGITQADINEFAQIDIHGIAVSGLLSHQSPTQIKRTIASITC